MRPAATILIGANALAAVLVGSLVLLHVRADSSAWHMAKELAGFDAIPAPQTVTRDVFDPKLANALPNSVSNQDTARLERVSLPLTVATEKAIAINRTASLPSPADLANTHTLDKLAVGNEPAGGNDFLSSTASPESQLITRVQTELVLLGYEPGKIDGVMGSRTRKAIMAFEADQSWHPTGEIDFDVITALRIEGAAPPTFSRDWFYASPADAKRHKPNSNSSPANLVDNGDNNGTAGAPTRLGGYICP